MIAARTYLNTAGHAILMDNAAIQKKVLRKLMNMSPPKWGASHTDERNLVKGLPKHIRGHCWDAIRELYRWEFLLRMKKGGAWHAALNPRKRGAILTFLGLRDPHKKL